MAHVNPRINAQVAHMPVVRAAVHKARDDLAAAARAEFASHDRPGGHEITTQDDELDALVSIEGPAPLSMEFGHWSGEGAGRRYVEGLHIFGKALAQVQAEGRR